MMPVPAVARQARCFDAEDGAHLARTYFCHQMLKPWAVHLSGAGATKILVDNLNLLEAQLSGVIGNAVLPPLALLIVNYLSWR